jgi:lipopolysaccharide export LptBFGC system permease protein LptF
MPDVDAVEVSHRENGAHQRRFDGRNSRNEPQCYAPRVRILSRRFLASYLATLAACVGGSLLALAIVDMLVDFDAIVEGGGAALRALLARVPERWLAEALPLASFAAAFLTVALPARRGELLGARAAGIHPARVALPILSAALAVGAAAAALPAPGAADARARSGPVGAASGTTGWLLAGERLIRIGHRDPDSGDLLDVRFFETDSEFRLRRSLRAAQARVAGNRWELQAPRDLRFDPGLPAAAARTAPAPAWVPAPDTDPGSSLASATADDVRGAASRVIATAGAPVLALIAIAIGLGVRASGSLANQALAALALAALYRGASQGAAFVTNRWALPASLAAGLVLAAFALAAAALWTRAPR